MAEGRLLYSKILAVGFISLSGMWMEAAEMPVASRVDVTQVSGYEGRRIEIVAPVKSVASSRTSGTRYYNFGDAYPRQALTARVDADDQEVVFTKRMPRIGQTVRVSGVIENSSTGYQIRIKEPMQIEIVEPDFPEALQSNSDGAEERDAFASALRRLLAEGDYAALEALSTRWRTEKSRFEDGLWKLSSFYGSLTPRSGSSAEDMDLLVTRIDAWSEQFPESVTPHILAAVVHVQRAWEARGSGWAHTVTEEGWEIFDKELQLARARLEGVGSHAEEICPHWRAVMQTVALGQQWSPKDKQTLFTRAVTREPEYLSYYFRHAFSLLPRWGGEPGAVQAFAASFPGDFGSELAARIPWSLQPYHENLFLNEGFKWEHVAKGFEQLDARYPNSAKNKSQAALMAGMASDRKLCKYWLDELGDNVDMRIWVNWENVELAKRWVDDTEHPPLAIFQLSSKQEDESE